MLNLAVQLYKCHHYWFATHHNLAANGLRAYSQFAQVLFDNRVIVTFLRKSESDFVINEKCIAVYAVKWGMA